MNAPGDITSLLQASAAGDAVARGRLMPLIYDELRVLGRAQRRQTPDQTLNTTALVHEAYLRLADRSELSWSDRRCFYAYAAKAMRSILQDNVRRRASVKRGAGAIRVDAELDELPLATQALDLIAVDQALEELTERTVFRDWRKARALLGTALGA